MTDLAHLKIYAEESIKTCQTELKDGWKPEFFRGMKAGYEIIISHIAWMEKENAKD
jgi:hypothetical protein